MKSIDSLQFHLNRNASVPIGQFGLKLSVRQESTRGVTVHQPSLGSTPGYRHPVYGLCPVQEANYIESLHYFQGHSLVQQNIINGFYTHG